MCAQIDDVQLYRPSCMQGLKLQRKMSPKDKQNIAS